MEGFKILLGFTLNRRIKNKTFVIVNGLLAIMMVLLFCCDFYIPKLFPNWNEKVSVACSSMEICDALGSVLPQFEVVDDSLEEANYYIDVSENYDIWARVETNPLVIAQIEMALRQVERLQLIASGQMMWKEVYLHSLEKNESKAQNWGFICITAVYFVALSFAGTVANDVVYEKSTRMMELILTSVDATTHLIAKLVGGWLVLLIQLGIFAVEFLSCMVLRMAYDGGEGLMKLAMEFGVIDKVYAISFKSIWKWIHANGEMCAYIFVGLILLFLGILLVQSILVIFSSFISSIEEAGNIQSPFYLLLMGVYYLTLFVNNSESMNHGLGRVLSLLPFFSMLCMPCRIFYHALPISDILISLLAATFALVVVLILGTPLYKKGVLSYQSIHRIK